MALRCGIVGLPNVGKSTLFNALTAGKIAAENYPFCTIEPNSGIVPVPDARLEALDAIVHSGKIIPATVELVDIAGLVRGASQGEGLGNQFLAHIRETHAILQVLRCFDDTDVTHVDGSVDPIRDVETIETELGLADLDTVERRLERTRKAARAGGKAGDEAKAEVAFFEKLLTHLSEGGPARSIEVPAEQAAAFRDCHLLTAKPVLYVANVDEAGLTEDNDYLRAVEAFAVERGATVLRVCAKIEAELSELEAEEKQEFLADLGLEEPGLHRLIRSAYTLLDLITFLTAGEKEVRAWTVDRGANAPQAAGTIHTDFERTFIRAEVIPFEAYVANGGEVGAKAAGVMRVEGKEYVMQDGDVVHFRGGMNSPADVLLRYSAGPKTGVFTDGSCEGNPGPGGWAAVWVEGDQIVEQASGSDPDTTNNRMELMGMIAALRMLPEDAETTLYSDSNLCVQTVNQWAAGWERRGWKRKSGPIANLELVKELYALALRHPGVEIKWIKAHDGSRWNEYADALATEAVRGRS